MKIKLNSDLSHILQKGIKEEGKSFNQHASLVMKPGLNYSFILKRKVNFTHLHLHTEYSLLDGASKISHVFKEAYKLGQKAVAITDHGNMYGAITFQNQCDKDKKESINIKPIIGCEFYVTADLHIKKGRTNGEYNHLILLAKNEEGYRNLSRLNSIAFVDGFYYKPRIDLNVLKEHSEGLICLSACLAGTIPQFLLHNDYENAKKYAEELKSYFDDGDFYIEIQDHGIGEEKYVLPLLKKLAKDINVKLVATNDVHYLKKSDAEMHDVMLCIQTSSFIDDPNRMRFETEEFYLKSIDRMAMLFKDVPEALDNTQEIVDKCNVRIVKHNLYPLFTIEDGTEPLDYLRKLTYEGLKERYGEITDEIKERAEYELGVISKTGYVDYFLIVWDFLHYAKTKGIPVGAGRGSGVSSIVAYSIGITNVDPLKYNLLFERFLNTERVSAPDFDIDFCFERRGEMIDYVINKYGSENVAQIITFGTMAASRAIKDVVKVYRMPYSEGDRITKLFPKEPKIYLKAIYGFVHDEKHPDWFVKELRDQYDSDETIRKVVDMAIKIEGLPRNSSTHAAGVVICREKISDFIPLQKNGDDVTTQYQKDDVEALGMLKMDFLGLKTLTDVSKTLQYIKENHNVDIDLNKLTYDDPKVFDLICSGATDAVFQLESAGMKRFMKDLQPRRFEEIIAGISLFRPGPMDSIPKYVASKKSGNITYPSPKLEPILNVTYGCIVYQEQVMQICQQLAGYSLGQADVIRRIMGKKKANDMVIQKKYFIDGKEEQRITKPDGSVVVEKAIAGAVKLGVDRPVAEQIFDDMAAFAEYAFNKSHAAAYAVLAYQTAFLKRYYAPEFLCAVLNDRITDIDEITKYTVYAKSINIEVLPPSINESRSGFSVENGNIRFGLAGIKNVGEKIVEEIIKERETNGPFKSMGDFLNRMDISINKRMIESMIKGGVFDSFKVKRSQLMMMYADAMDRIQQEKKDRLLGQINMFDMLGDISSPVEIKYPDIDEFDTKTKLSMEKEVLGVYVTGHPLSEYKNILDSMSFNSSFLRKTDDYDIPVSFDGQSVVIAGMISEFRRIVTKRGSVMASAKIEDYYGTIEVVAYDRAYQDYKNLLQEDSIVIIHGKMSGGEYPKIIIDKVESIEDRSTNSNNNIKSNYKLYIKANEKELDTIVRIVKSYKGNIPVIFVEENTNKAYNLDSSISYSDDLISELLITTTRDRIKLVEINPKKEEV